MKIDKYFSKIILALLFFSTFAVSMQIGLFGDDYYYGTFIKNNFWGLHKNHYLTVNGRAIVHFLDTIFLSLPKPIWALLNSFMLTYIAYSAGKIIELFSNKKENYIKSILIFSFGILMLNIIVIRQSVYWVTGSFNYVYPIFMLFWYLYSLFKSYKNNFSKNQFLLILLALFASATVEQGTMMVFGATLVLFLYIIFKNKKLKETTNYKKILFILIATFLGTCATILAPSQFIRIGLEKSSSSNLVENIFNCMLFLIKTFALEYTPQVLLAVTSLALFLFFSKKREKFSIDEIYLLVTTIILGIGSQIMMTVSPVYGERNTLFGIFMIMLFTAILFSKISFGDNKKIKKISYCITIILMIIAYINIFKTYKNYKISNDIQNENINIISEHKKSNEKDDTINLYMLKNDLYGWSMPYVSAYHEYWFKVYYEIENLNINWISK